MRVRFMRVRFIIVRVDDLAAFLYEFPIVFFSVFWGDEDRSDGGLFWVEIQVGKKIG